MSETEREPNVERDAPAPPSSRRVWGGWMALERAIPDPDRLEYRNPRLDPKE